jgi:polyhydroxybutyrate depolymerase
VSVEPPASVPDSAPPGVVGDTTLQIVSGGLQRTAAVYVPPSYDGVHPMPIVLVLHPLSATAGIMRDIVKVEPFADDPQHGFIALFPDGIMMSWNAGECCSMDPKPDDVGFMHDLVATVAGRWRVDPARLYAMGYSNGAALAHRLACELPGGVTAFVSVAGALGREIRPTCSPPHATPVLAIHGTADEIVPYSDDSDLIPLASLVTFPSALSSDAFWANAEGCTPPAPPYFVQGDVSCARRACRDGATVGLCTVTGGGHQWPGGPWVPGLGTSTEDLDATAAAVALFREHGL